MKIYADNAATTAVSQRLMKYILPLEGAKQIIRQLFPLLRRGKEEEKSILFQQCLNIMLCCALLMS